MTENDCDQGFHEYDGDGYCKFCYTHILKHGDGKVESEFDNERGVWRY